VWARGTALDPFSFLKSLKKIIGKATPHFLPLINKELS